MKSSRKSVVTPRICRACRSRLTNILHYYSILFWPRREWIPAVDTTLQPNRSCCGRFQLHIAAAGLQRAEDSWQGLVAHSQDQKRAAAVLLHVLRDGLTSGPLNLLRLPWLRVILRVKGPRHVNIMPRVIVSSFITHLMDWLYRSAYGRPVPPAVQGLKRSMLTMAYVALNVHNKLRTSQNRRSESSQRLSFALRPCCLDSLQDSGTLFCFSKGFSIKAMRRKPFTR